MSDETEDHDPFGFPPVLDDVVFEDKFRDGRWLAWCWDANIWVAPDEIEPVLQNLIVAVSLLDSPRSEGVQKCHDDLAVLSAR